MKSRRLATVTAIFNNIDNTGISIRRKFPIINNTMATMTADNNGRKHIWIRLRNEECNTTLYKIPYETTVLMNRVISHAHAMLSVVRKQTAAMANPITVQHVLISPP